MHIVVNSKVTLKLAMYEIRDDHEYTFVTCSLDYIVCTGSLTIMKPLLHHSVLPAKLFRFEVGQRFLPEYARLLEDDPPTSQEV